jgi:excisionase family DNA binding protein
MTEVLDLQGACEYLQVAKTTMYKYLKTGSIPAFKVGRMYRFKREVLDEWMRQQIQTHKTSVKKNIRK